MMPAWNRRALLAMTRFAGYGGRSGEPSSRRPACRSAMWERTCESLCICQGAAITQPSSEGVQNAQHDELVVPIQVRAKAQQQTSLYWSQLRLVRRKVICDLDAAVVTSADDFKRIDERQVLEIVIDGAQRNMKFCCQMSSGILFTLA